MFPKIQHFSALAAKEGELDRDREGRRQVLNAALNGIKRAVNEAPRGKADKLEQLSA